jgi:hypothetical protein
MVALPMRSFYFILSVIILIILIINICPVICDAPRFISDFPTSQTSTIPAEVPKVSANDQKGDASNDAGIVQRAYFPSNYDSAPIEIEKTIDPNETSDYVVDTPINVSVIIRSLSSYNLTGLRIKEEADDNFIIENNSGKCIILDPIYDSFNRINYSNGYEMNKINNYTLTTLVPCLRPREWVAYTYTVVPHKKGFLDADTLVNFGNSSYFKSKYSSWGIEVKPERFEVLSSSTGEADISENIKLIYTIKYFGNNLNKKNFRVKLDNSSQDFVCVCDEEGYLNFNSSEYQLFNPTIRYKKTGTYYLPNIIINNVPYAVSGPRTISIEDIWIRYKEFSNFALTLINIAAFIIISLLLRPFKGIEKCLNEIQEELQKMPNQIIPPKNESPKIVGHNVEPLKNGSKE